MVDNEACRAKLDADAGGWNLDKLTAISRVV
jgi:hypothetical protein